MYNYQLQYDQQLGTFLTDAETALNNMQDKVWATVHALAKNEGIMFNACLGLMLQMPNLLLKIPLDISFQTQIPLTIAYCPESSIYRRWCPEQGGVSPLHKEVRVSQTLSKVLGVTHQSSEGVDHPPSQAPSDNSAGLARLRGSRCDPKAMPKVSLLPTAGDQAWWAQQQVIIQSTLTLLKMVRCRAASLNSPTMREMAPGKMTMPKKRAG